MPLEPSPVTHLQTERLHLRPVGESDRHEFIRIQTVRAKHFKPWFPERQSNLDALS